MLATLRPDGGRDPARRLSWEGVGRKQSLAQGLAALLDGAAHHASGCGPGSPGTRRPWCLGPSQDLQTRKWGSEGPLG